MRRYDVNEYSSSWNMQHFYVSLSVIAAGVTPFKTKIHADPNMRLRVDFFQEESILEALARDRRFDVKKLGACGVNCDRKPYPLSYKAVNCQNKTVEIYNLPKKETSVPHPILPRPHPDPRKTIFKVEPIKAKKAEDHVVTAGPSIAGLPLDSSTPELTASKSLASARKTFAQLIENAFQTKTLDSKLKGQLVKECGVKFRNFALEQNLSISASQLRDLTRTLDAVGAIFKLNPAGYPQLVGTCFGTGTQYIMTNCHVYDEIKADLKDAVFVDFNFEKGLFPSDQKYELDFLLLSCVEMDFAILKLKERSDELPAPCIFSTGVTIMDPNDSRWSLLEGQCLQLIGHPNGQPKQLDLFCPVITTPQDSSAFYFYALRRGETNAQACNAYFDSQDPKRAMYHVSSFFHGSSGSPGILFQYGKKMLMVLHTRGLYLYDPDKTFIEQGVQFTEIVKYVHECIQLAQGDPSGQNRLRGVRLTDIFPGVGNWSSCPMDINH